VDRRDPRDTPGSSQWRRLAGDARLQSIFDTRTEAWRAVGLQDEVRRQDGRRARLRALVFVPLLAAVIAAYALRHRLFGASADTPVRIATVPAVLILGWAMPATSVALPLPRSSGGWTRRAPAPWGS
jgi:hypothetical protein